MGALDLLEVVIIITTIGVQSDHRANFKDPSGIQIKFLYLLVPCSLHMIHNISMKGEGSLAVRTYPNIV
jgi:hypothetical protein